MANLSITSRCNRRCDYCFATNTWGKGDIDVSEMSLEIFERSLEFLIRSHIEEARLLGGEPTLHPEFNRFVDRALECGLRILVFTGGLIPAKALERLERIAADRITVLVNVIAAEEGTPSMLQRQVELYSRLRQRVILGINIKSPAINLDFLLDLIDEYKLSPRIRLGIAHPVLRGTNSYLHPRHYPEVGHRVTEFGLVALKKGVQIEFDCGWVPCMFPKGALQALGKNPGNVGSRCNPILDIMPDGRVISCYPLMGHGMEWLPKKQNAAWLRAQLTKKQTQDRIFRLYKACASCRWRAGGLCVGGCLAAAMRRIRRNDFSFAIEAGQDTVDDTCHAQKSVSAALQASS